MLSQKPDQNGSRPDVPGTAAFAKFMRVLQAVADRPGEMTVGRLCQITELPRPTVHRIAAALVTEGMLSEGDDGRLCLGPRLLTLAFQSWDGSLLRQAAQEHLVRLRDSLDETVHLAVHDRGEMVYIDKLESRRTVRMASRIGTRVSLHSTSVGKAWLATLPDEEVGLLLDRAALIARTPHSIIAVDRLRDDIGATRARGYSLDLQENELDICCYGMSLHGRGGQALGCISVSLPRYRFETMPEATTLEAMQACLDGIGRAVGGRS
ncbi:MULTISPECIES: IclR family transcriptional regulator [Roseixanthobacter]|uniref:IclR family transcriptional regulator n=1 Tax=Xanthobacteraceae TaxID=335928 RepID=UPI003727E5CC